ncbi:MAG: S-layer homology domain-containing protein, partial [Clostridia bacterium]|nr:S-layer homology domain-containing protein [Clostridia bacterium]
TRAELAVVFARYFAGREIYLADAPLTDSFTDGSKIAKWARDAVETIRLCGIIAGDKAGNFNPSSSATRAEIAMMITRYLSAEKIGKLDYLMRHIGSYLPADDRFSSLEFTVSGELTAAGFGSRILPCLGLQTDRYELLADDGEMAALREEWVMHGVGEKIIAVLHLALRDNLTGEESAVYSVRFRLLKTDNPIYVDPDDYDPGVDPAVYSEMLEASAADRNNTARLYKALTKGQDTGSLKVAFIGGSITEGTGSTFGGYGGFARIAANWLQRHIAPDLEYVNASAGGTTSVLGATRFSRDVLSAEPDVIFIEYAVNNDPGNVNYPKMQESFESMIIDGLSAENEPAVVVVISHGGQGNVDFMCNVAAHYGVPVVNVAAGVDLGEEKGALDDAEFRPDGCHPSDMGHQIMSDMIEKLFLVTLDEWPDPETAEAAIPPVPGDTVTPARFRGLTLTDAEYLDIVSPGSFEFRGTDFGSGFSHGATSAAGSAADPFVFTVTAATVDLVVARGSVFEVTVDGGEPYVCGDDAFAVVISDTPATHTISVRPYFDGVEATLLAVACN